ncbi:hypothetical protein LTR36_005450 [Oleoguttula mirabilis]|uniref:Uncharacterized protein n=1 Tax=Oleoguttula mirabilis TaxID=1507867 RepID=A0AAV9JEA8_9PEZI|nr:hypothetical protein LTR36_005450 [Oleoguttula mirabilis]
MDMGMDIFGRLNAEAIQRHASPEPTAVAAPPPVHDPNQPSALARRRDRSPLQPVATGNARPSARQTSDYDADQDGNNNNDEGEEGEGDAETKPIDLDAPKTPTSLELFEMLQKAAPQLLDRFCKYNDGKNDLATGWEKEYRLLKKREEERVRKLWGPLEENPELRRLHEQAVAAREVERGYMPPVDMAVGGLPLAMPDSGSEGEGGGGRGRSPVNRARDGVPEGRRGGAEATGERDGAAGERVRLAMPRSSPPERPHARPAKLTSKPASNPSSPPNSDGGIPLPSITAAKFALDVKLRLLPALVLLATPKSTRNIALVRRAEDAARAAHRFVRESAEYATPLGQALNGRCCFYRGVCRMGRTQIDGKEHNGLVWFRRATEDARGVFVEAKWAEEWIRRFRVDGMGSSLPLSSFGDWPRPTTGEGGSQGVAAEGVNGPSDERPTTSGSTMSPTAAERPPTAGSWVSGMWASVTQALRGNPSDGAAKPPPFEILQTFTRNPLLAGVGAAEAAEEESPVSPKNRTGAVASRRPGMGERIPTFTTLQSGGSTEYDHHGVAWSHSRPFGKGEILPGKPMEFVASPDRMTGVDDEDDEVVDDIPYNLHGGHVPIRQLKAPHGSFSDQGALGALKVANGSGVVSPPASLWAMGSGSGGETTQAPQQEQPQKQQQQQPAPRIAYRIVNGAPSDSSSSDAHSGALLPLHEPSHLPTPGHSPSYIPPQPTSPPAPSDVAGRSPRRSIAFAASLTNRLPSFTGSHDGSQQQPSPTSGGVGLYARRKLSQIVGIPAITTAREADPLVEMEEGQSPYRSMFSGGGGGGGGGGGDGSLPRKRSSGSGSGGGAPKSPDEMV